MKKFVVLIPLLFCCCVCRSQSFEAMTGAKRVFIDAQYLRFFDAEHKISLFARARATAEYRDQRTDLFTGAYLNYTTKSGFGGTIIGRISSANSGIDMGIHYFKSSKNLLIYVLPSININDELLYSWFSILRFTPELRQYWRIYSSLELFSAFGHVGHLGSVQRARLGVDIKGYQFGLAVNLNENRNADVDINAGLFFRKQF